MTKQDLLRCVFRSLPIPGRLLSSALNLVGCDPASIPMPVVSRDRWNSFKIRITDPTDLVQRQIFFQGYFEYHESVFMRKFLKPAQVFVDIGANIGWHTLIAASCVGPRGRVIGCEPATATFAQLAKNVELNHFGNVTLHRLGLGAQPGSFDIFECEEGNSGANSLYASCGQAPVESVTIENGDAFFQTHGIHQVDLCKIDVEGAEFDVLNGLKQTLADRKISCMLIEANDAALRRSGHSADELISGLIGYGFRLRDPRTSEPVLRASDVPRGQNLIAELQ